MAGLSPSPEAPGSAPGGPEPPTVPAPKPPDDPDAWYAPTVRDQYELHPDVIATIREAGEGFDYRVREPSLSPAGADALSRVEEHFSDANLRRPVTREGATERMDAGLDPKYRRIVDRLTDLPPEARRRVEYRALRDLRCLGELTPLALDSGIEVADTAGDRLVVHTDDYAPADTALPADADFLSRFASERVETHAVGFRNFRVPVVIYREHLLANDAFTTKYAVQEPDLLPGDEELIRECKDRIWETNVDGVVEDRAAFVRERARTFLSRRLTARNTRAWLDAAAYRTRAALAEYDLAVPPVNHRFSTDRLSDLVYYVMRDFVGHGKLTIPIRDDLLEDIEANRVGERIKVVPRGREIGHGERIPTNLSFDDESAFVNVVTQMAAADGTELNASNPSAKVNLQPEGVPDGTTIRCAVALGVISEDGPHISIRKQAPEAMTPVDLLESESLSTEIVTLLWQAYEHHGVVLFSGPTGAGKTTLMNAHMPFVPYRDRPISIDEGSREVRLPHETSVSLTTRDHESDYKRVTMADLMTECNYLNPDVEVIAEINTPASFRTFAESLNTGHSIIGTTHAEDVEKLVNRVVEQGLPPYLLRELDLVVFPRRVDGERYVGEVVELLSESAFEALDADRSRCGAVRKDDATVYWNTVAYRDTDGRYRFAYDHPQLGDDERDRRHRFFHRLAARGDRTVEDVEAEFHRKHRYVQYLQREGMDDFEALFGFLSDLQTNEAATVERANRGAP
ncbi:type II/IV secretion system ATPase subunit [Halorussus marinus]|uniref:type II/IV secretion system ATPase subunit n=1 Tax=Halorussus marinus TaxID=2505976 RepID=UPI00106ED37F|nr:type II/IV secretion system ATPase subunit [Halorussus marinus]